MDKTEQFLTGNSFRTKLEKFRNEKLLDVEETLYLVGTFNKADASSNSTYGPPGKLSDSMTTEQYSSHCTVDGLSHYIKVDANKSEAFNPSSMTTFGPP